MARNFFGGDLASWVMQRNDELLLNLVQLAPSVEVTFWDAPTGGTQFDDLLLNSSPVTSITSSDGSDGRERGSLPIFEGPDDDFILVMWADAGGGARYLIFSNSIGNFINQNRLDIAALETAVAGKVDLSTLTTKGDLYVATGPGTITRQPAGADGTVLIPDSAQATGLKYGAPADIAGLLEYIIDSIAAALVAGTGIDIDYDDGLGLISVGTTGLVPVSTVTDHYTLALADAGTAVHGSSASPLNITVPPNSSVAFPVGTVIEIAQLGAGQVAIVQGAGVTVRTPDTLLLRAQYSAASLRQYATDVWLLVGDLAPVSTPPPGGPGWTDLSGLAPSHNIPVATTASVGSSASPTIAGSAGWWREKRSGVAETAPGGSQSSTNALDFAGSTYFSYPALPESGTTEPHPANPGQYVRTLHKPGGAPQSARWLWSVAFITEAPEVEVRLNAVATNGRFGLVFVDGLRVDDDPIMMTSPPNAGSGAAVKLAFPDSRERRIWIAGLNHDEGRFGGVAVTPGYTVAEAPAPGRTIAIIGDSYVNGASGVNGTSTLTTFVWQLALKMGAEAICQAGIGATGYIATLSGEPTSNFAGRVDSILSLNPDVVIVAGGRNDTSTGLQTAVEALLDELAAVDEVYVIPTASESTQASVRTAISDACTAKSRPFIDVDIDGLPKMADAIHPTAAGHQQLAEDAYTLIEALFP